MESVDNFLNYMSDMVDNLSGIPEENKANLCRFLPDKGFVTVYFSLMQGISEFPVKQAEYESVRGVAELFHHSLLTNQMIMVLAAQSPYGSKDKKVKVFNNNLKQIKAQADAFALRLETAISEGKENKFWIFNKQENRDELYLLINLLNDLLPCLDICQHIEKLCTGKKISDEDFFDTIVKLNKDLKTKIEAIVEKFGDSFENSPMLSIVLQKIVEKVSKDFSYIETKANEFEQEKLFAESKKQEVIPVRREPAIAESELERRKWIKLANDKYDEFVQDTMRDLQAQVPYSAMHMYEILLKKFEKFQNRFEMPLDSSVSVGIAKEASAHLDRIINYVSEISENSKVSIIYGNTQMQ